MSYKDEIRKAALNAELPGRIVSVKEWGDTKVGVRGLSIHESNEFYKSIQRKDDEPADPDRLHVQIMIRTIVDPESGEPVFSQADAETLLHGPRPTELLRVALELAGLGGESAVEAAAADLAETPDGEVS